jgi:tetratricopeptide (TPR) repeat protein
MSDSRRREVKEAYVADELATVVALGEILLRSNPDDGPTLMRVGDSLSAMGQYERAGQYLERALQLAPDAYRHQVLWRLGKLCEHRGDFLTAARYYEEAHQCQPGDGTSLIFLGAALASLGRLDEAETAHRQATLCSDGCIDEAYYNLGLIYRSKGRLEDARDCFELAIEIDPDYQKAKNALADVMKAQRIIQSEH